MLRKMNLQRVLKRSVVLHASERSQGILEEIEGDYFGIRLKSGALVWDEAYLWKFI